MSDTLKRDERAAGSRMVSWTPFRDLLGFDPFHAMRGLEYDVTRTDSGYEVEVPVSGSSPRTWKLPLRTTLFQSPPKATGARLRVRLRFPRTSMPTRSRPA
jgi:hypothetical protein